MPAFQAGHAGSTPATRFVPIVQRTERWPPVPEVARFPPTPKATADPPNCRTVSTLCNRFYSKAIGWTTPAEGTKILPL